jgi:predicted homoserine dehydrogenase-like protein
MIIVHSKLAERASKNDPVKVAIVRAGYSGRAVTYQITRNIERSTLSKIAPFRGKVGALYQGCDL